MGCKLQGRCLRISLPAPCNLAKEKQSTCEKLGICTTWPLLPSLHAALFSLHISRWKNEGIGGGLGFPKFSFQLISSKGNRKKIFIAPAMYMSGRSPKFEEFRTFFTLGSFSFHFCGKLDVGFLRADFNEVGREGP